MEMPLRYVQAKEYARAYPLEATNGIKNLCDTDSDCAQAVAADLGRIFDKAILKACFADAESGDNGRHPVKFPANQIIQDDGKCLTLEKLQSAKTMLDAADGPRNDSRAIVASSQQINNLYTATDPASPERKPILALMGNDAAQVKHFNFVCMDAMIQTDSRNHLLPCFLSSGILLVYEELSARRVCVRGTEELLVKLSYGAVRAKEDRVVQIACKEHP